MLGDTTRQAGKAKKAELLPGNGIIVMVSSRTYKAFGIIIVKTVEKTGTILVGTGITYQVAFHYSILSAGQKFREK